MRLRKILVVAKKEFMDNVRNRWLIVLTAIFMVLTVASSILAGEGKLGRIEATVITLLSLSSMLVPIIAVVLAYGTIAAEAESGALSVVLAYPVGHGLVGVEGLWNFHAPHNTAWGALHKPLGVFLIPYEEAIHSVGSGGSDLFLGNDNRLNMARHICSYGGLAHRTVYR